MGLYLRVEVPPMRRLALLTATLACLLAGASPAWAGTTWIVRGAGFGHGIGMSQYGALGGAGTYRGLLELRPGGSSLTVVNVVGLDAYVQGVVPGEMVASWPAEALKAQAVAARSYALATDAGGAVFDQYADTRSQVYGGMNSETPASNAAVRATAGQVATYGGQVATTYFFSTSGGKTENVENVFYGATPEPYLK